jgi:hypothetical protein
MSTLWYRVGTMSSNSVAWGDSYPYDTASTASVACYDCTAVEVHTAEFVESHTADQSAFWCKVGTVSPDSNTIVWVDRRGCAGIF